MLKGPEKRQKEFIDLCRRRGMRVTGQRLEVYREIAENLDHPSADMIYEAVRKRVPAISLDTVYRTLDTLEEFGLIYRVNEVCARAHFDANLEPHHHFFCVRCNNVLDVPPVWEDREEIQDKMADYGRVKSVSLQIRGICNKCEQITELEKEKESWQASKEPKPKRTC